MKERSELFSIFQSFYNEIKAQFGVPIRTLQSDNAKEYLSTSFRSFMASHRILHQTSCSHTLNKMGLLRVKIDISLRLLVHS